MIDEANKIIEADEANVIDEIIAKIAEVDEANVIIKIVLANKEQ